MTVPGYWMNETSGVLAPVVRAYLEGAELDPHQVAIMRVYLRQWIRAEPWLGLDVEQLRRDVDAIVTTADIRSWLARAVDAGIDPL